MVLSGSVKRTDLFGCGWKESWVFHAEEFFDSEHDPVPPVLSEHFLLITQSQTEAQICGGTTQPEPITPPLTHASTR